MKTPLLIWPECWHKKSDFDKFFMGMPFIGLDNRLRRHFQSILKLRKIDIYTEWENEELYKKQLKISSLIKYFFAWDSHFFHPNDKCDILMYDFPCCDLASVSFFLHLKDIDALKMKITDYDFLENLDYKLFLEKYVK